MSQNSESHVHHTRFVYNSSYEKNQVELYHMPTGVMVKYMATSKVMANVADCVVDL